MELQNVQLYTLYVRPVGSTVCYLFRKPYANLHYSVRRADEYLVNVRRGRNKSVLQSADAASTLSMHKGVVII